MILYLLVLEFLMIFQTCFHVIFLQIDMLYQGPPVKQSELYLSISYYKCLFVSIIHNIPTLCNIVFNTNEVIISWSVVLILSIDTMVYFTQLLHLMDIFRLYFVHLSPYYTNHKS